MAVAYLIPADLRHNMDALATQIRDGRFEAELARLAPSDDAQPGSIRERIAKAVTAARGDAARFADRAVRVAEALDRLEPKARNIAIFMLLPCAGDCGPRQATESDFAFIVRLFGSHDLVWRVAGGAVTPQLPGLEAVLDVTAEPLAAARRYLDKVPRAAAWLGWLVAGGAHPDAVKVREPWVVRVTRWLARDRPRAMASA